MKYIFFPTLCSCLPVRNDLFILALGTTEIRGNFLFPKFSQTFSISEIKCLMAYMFKTKKKNEFLNNFFHSIILRGVDLHVCSQEVKTRVLKQKRLCSLLVLNFLGQSRVVLHRLPLVRYRHVSCTSYTQRKHANQYSDNRHVWT